MARPLQLLLCAALLAAALVCAAPAAAAPDPPNGGVSPTDPQFRPPRKARIRGGLAIAPRGAPRAVVAAIAAGNRIVGMPYRYGGGHASFEDTGYDCSGAISYALHGAGLLTSPLASPAFMSWGSPGPGRWITVFAHEGHAFVLVAGLRFDTGHRTPRARRHGVKPGRGPRWDFPRPTTRFVARHPEGL